MIKRTHQKQPPHREFGQMHPILRLLAILPAAAEKHQRFWLLRYNKTFHRSDKIKHAHAHMLHAHAHMLTCSQMLLQLTAHKRFGSIDLKIDQCLILEARELFEKSMSNHQIKHTKNRKKTSSSSSPP